MHALAAHLLLLDGHNVTVQTCTSLLAAGLEALKLTELLLFTVQLFHLHIHLLEAVFEPLLQLAAVLITALPQGLQLLHV